MTGKSTGNLEVNLVLRVGFRRMTKDGGVGSGADLKTISQI